MTNENENEPFVLNMDLVEEQLKQTSPEQLAELSKRVSARVEQTKAPDFANMGEGEFEEAKRKLLR